MICADRRAGYPWFAPDSGVSSKPTQMSSELIDQLRNYASCDVSLYVKGALIYADCGCSPETQISIVGIFAWPRASIPGFPSGRDQSDRGSFYRKGHPYKHLISSAKKRIVCAK